MNITAILYAALALGGISVFFGVVLSVVSKKFATAVDDKVVAVTGALPGANCGACGYAGCEALAHAIVKGEAGANSCPAGGASTAKKVGEIMSVAVEADPPKVARVVCQGEVGVSKERYEYAGYHSCQMASTMAGGPKKCAYACVGLGDCARVCKFDAVSVKDGLARVDEEKCTACGMCVKACPRLSIKLFPRDASVVVRCQNRDSGRMAREACMTACIACKRCAQVCKFDAITVEDGFARIDSDKCTACGECLKVCPCGCIKSVR